MNKFKIENSFRFIAQISCYGLFEKRNLEVKQNQFLDLETGTKSYLKIISKKQLNRKIPIFLGSSNKYTNHLILKPIKTPSDSFVSQLLLLSFYSLQIHLKKKKFHFLSCFCKCYIIKKKFKGYSALLFGRVVYLPKKHAFLPKIGENILIKLLSVMNENIVVSQRLIIKNKSRNLLRLYHLLLKK